MDIKMCVRGKTSRKWLTVAIWMSWSVMDDFHGWLSWMTFMDDFHGWLSWMTVMDDCYGWLSWMTFMYDFHGWMDCHGLFRYLILANFTYWLVTDGKNCPISCNVNSDISLEVVNSYNVVWHGSSSDQFVHINLHFKILNIFNQRNRHFCLID